MIASHYAEPVARVAAEVAAVYPAPSEGAEPIAELAPGELFSMLDDTLGWAWGYVGNERRVGYVRSEALS